MSRVDPSTTEGAARGRSLHSKFFLWTALPIVLVLAAILGLGLVVLANRIERGIEQDLTRASRYSALEFDSLLRKASKTADEMAAVLTAQPIGDEAKLYDLLQSGLERNPLVYGAAIAFEPGAFPGHRLFAPYVYRQAETLARMDIAKDAYDYTDSEWEWFNLPRMLGRAIWTDPYFDEGAGNILMVTYAVPVLRHGHFAAVVTVDLPLRALSAQMQDELGALEHFMVLSGSGRFVYNSYVPELIGDRRSASELFHESGRPDLANAFLRMMRTGEGVLHVRDLKELWGVPGQLLFYAPIDAAAWFFVAGIDESSALLPVRNAAVAGVALVVLVVTLMLLVTWQTSGTVTRRVARVQQTAVRIADGDLTARTGIRSSDEIGRLADAVDLMAARLDERAREIIEINHGLEETVRRRTRQLEETTETIEGVFENMGQGVIMFDGDFRVRAHNARAVRYLGLAEGFLDGAPSYAEVLADLIARGAYPAEDVAVAVRRTRQDLARRQRVVFELPSPDGRVYEVQRRSMPDGGFVATLSDITERKQADDALKESREALAEKTGVLEAVFRSMNEGIVAFDRELKLLAWNEAYLKIRDYPSEFAEEGRPFEAFVRYDVARYEYGRGDAEDTVRSVVERARHSEPHRFERLRPDGTWIEVRGGPIQGGGFVSTYADITERKLAEEMIIEAHRLITESVEYASNIQRSLLPAPRGLAQVLGEHFVLWEPRDVVGGDFYWLRECDGGHLLVVCDCTGHGVPGAFMTIIGTAALDQALTAQPDGDPARILGHMNRFVQHTLLQDTEEGHADDGMELGICRIEADGRRLTYAGARFSLLVLAPDGAVREIKGDRTGIGYRHVDPAFSFTNHVLGTAADSTHYLYTDGIVDQIGGEKHRAFGRKRLMRLIADMHCWSLAEQAIGLRHALYDYQGEENRRDDVTVVGFRCRNGAAPGPAGAPPVA